MINANNQDNLRRDKHKEKQSASLYKQATRCAAVNSKTRRVLEHFLEAFQIGCTDSRVGWWDGGVFTNFENNWCTRLLFS